MNRIWNAGNLLAAILFFAMIGAVGAVEAENYTMAWILTAVVAVCAWLASREGDCREEAGSSANWERSGRKRRRIRRMGQALIIFCLFCRKNIVKGVREAAREAGNVIKAGRNRESVGADKPRGRRGGGRA